MELDGRRVIVVPVDLSYIVNVDGTSKAAANTPRRVEEPMAVVGQAA